MTDGVTAGVTSMLGGDWGPVAPAVFKTVVSLHGDGWVRLPFTSAIFWPPEEVRLLFLKYTG